MLKKPDMTPEQFEQAVKASYEWIIRENGILSLFGGNVCVSKHFGDYCRILGSYLPEENRGLWTNNLGNNGAVAAQTFTEKSRFNINVHGRDANAVKFRQHMPWARVHGLRTRSEHSSIFLASQDFIPEEEIWKRVENCTYDIEWSAIIVQEAPEWNTLGGYSCEIASTHARVNGEALGVPIEPGWLDLLLPEFEHQYRYACPRCSGCLNVKGIDDYPMHDRPTDQFSRTNAHLTEKLSPRRNFQILEELPKSAGRAIDYLGKAKK